MAVLHVNPEQASHMLANGELDLVDVREPHEWACGHLPGARHVPLAILARNPRAHLPRDGVLFVCAQGGLSLAAGAVALGAGLRAVYSLDGGVVDWARQGFPLERG